MNSRDLAAIVGLAMIGYGCYLIAPPLALLTVGWVLLGMAIWGHLRNDNPEQNPGESETQSEEQKSGN